MRLDNSSKVNDKQNAILQILRLELCRREFWEFCLYYDQPFFESRVFLHSVADAFQEIEDGKIRSLSVSMPPRAGKSYISSLFCAWTIGRNPSKSVMRNACTATLYLKFSYDVRNIVKSDKFKEVFPTVILSDDKANLQGWNTNKAKQVSYFGAGVGGTIIGFGADNIAVTDDLYTGLEQALSDTQNDRIIQWKEATHDSRFESGCKRIDIGTRWSLNDVIGRQMNDGIYDKSIVIPALIDGKSFCESVMTTDEYLTKKARTEPSIWEAEYMQSPVDIQGRLFNDLRTIPLSEFNNIKDKIQGCIAYCDVADAGADFTAFAILAVANNDMYLVDYVFNKSNTDITMPLIADKLNKWNVTYCRVESNSMGAMFARGLQKITTTRILPVHNSVNKITRIIMQSVWIQQRITFVNNGNPECELFLQNVLHFSKEGKNKNDDAPDCLAGLSIFAQSMFRQLA
jgi:predicted phage terminase large subunit-like protein